MRSEACSARARRRAAAGGPAAFRGHALTFGGYRRRDGGTHEAPRQPRALGAATSRPSAALWIPHRPSRARPRRLPELRKQEPAERAFLRIVRLSDWPVGSRSFAPQSACDATRPNGNGGPRTRLPTPRGPGPEDALSRESGGRRAVGGRCFVGAPVPALPRAVRRASAVLQVVRRIAWRAADRGGVATRGAACPCRFLRARSIPSAPGRSPRPFHSAGAREGGGLRGAEANAKRKARPRRARRPRGAYLPARREHRHRA